MQIYTHLGPNYSTTMIFFRQSFSINYYSSSIQHAINSPLYFPEWTLIPNFDEL